MEVIDSIYVNNYGWLYAPKEFSKIIRDTFSGDYFCYDHSDKLSRIVAKHYFILVDVSFIDE